MQGCTPGGKEGGALTAYSGGKSIGRAGPGFCEFKGPGYHK